MKEKIKEFFYRFKKLELLISLSIIIFGILFDQITKIIVSKNMNLGQSIIIINKFFSITYIRNIGAAWGMMKDSYLFLGIITVIALCAFIYMLSLTDFKKKKIYSISVPFMISGTIGNLIDRSIRAFFNGQGVVDFLDFQIFGYDFPVFNIADILLVVGVIMLGIHLIFFSDDKKGSEQDASRND